MQTIWNCLPFPDKKTVHSAKIWNVDPFPDKQTVHSANNLKYWPFPNKQQIVQHYYTITDIWFGHAILIYIHIYYITVNTYSFILYTENQHMIDIAFIQLETDEFWVNFLHIPKK